MKKPVTYLVNESYFVQLFTAMAIMNVYGSKKKKGRAGLMASSTATRQLAMTRMCGRKCFQDSPYVKRQQVSSRNASVETRRILFPLFSPQRVSHLEEIYVMIGMKETHRE